MVDGLNKTVCKFQYKKRKYEVDCLLDSDLVDGKFEFHIFDVTDGLNADGSSVYVAAFEAQKGADYEKWAKETLKNEVKI